jgi:hypothetical protein
MYCLLDRETLQHEIRIVLESFYRALASTTTTAALVAEPRADIVVVREMPNGRVCEMWREVVTVVQGSAPIATV